MWKPEEVPIETLQIGDVFSLRGYTYQLTSWNWELRQVYFDSYHYRYVLPFGTMVTPGYKYDASLKPWYNKGAGTLINQKTRNTNNEQSDGNI